jgi:SAM-dependent methyltransferase
LHPLNDLQYQGGYFMTDTKRLVWDALVHMAGFARYRLGLAPRFSDVPDHRLVQLAEGSERLAPGRALDLGCGTGRNAIYLASQGWDTTGIDMVTHALETARRKTEARRLAVRFVQGDVTRLTELDIVPAFDLIMDGGCYHMIPAHRREAYALSVTRVAAARARLIIVGVRQRVGAPEELAARLPGWRLLQAHPVPGDEMAEYFCGRTLFGTEAKRDVTIVMRYELERTSD